MASAKFRSSNGFSLIEVLVSMGVMSVIALGVAQLFAASTRANRVARGQSSATALAEQKMEQLRSLTWGFDLQGQGLPLSDTATNLATTPPTQGGGGLNPSPSDALETNRTGYFDYLDASGVWVGTGGSIPPPTTSFVRRWSIQPLPTNPNNTLILQVLVSPLSNDQLRTAQSNRQRLPGDALLTSVKTRKAS
jgi:prepilin-type N-terminal cleavage/methylation domain-containing protein